MIENESAAYIAVHRLQHAYADVVNRHAWDELASIFAPQTKVVVDVRVGEPIVLDGPAKVGEFIAEAISRFDFFEFVILSAVVKFADESHATGRMYMCELRRDVASGAFTQAFGVYHDTFARDGDGRWWFTDRRYSSLARTAPALHVFPFPTDPI